MLSTQDIDLVQEIVLTIVLLTNAGFITDMRDFKNKKKIWEQLRFFLDADHSYIESVDKYKQELSDAYKEIRNIQISKVGVKSMDKEV